MLLIWHPPSKVRARAQGAPYIRDPGYRDSRASGHPGQRPCTVVIGDRVIGGTEK